MKIETILSAMLKSYFSHNLSNLRPRRHRQWRVFRDRIIRMDEEKDAEIKFLKETCCHD